MIQTQGTYFLHQVVSSHFCIHINNPLCFDNCYNYIKSTHSTHRPGASNDSEREKSLSSDWILSTGSIPSISGVEHLTELRSRSHCTPTSQQIGAKSVCVPYMK